MLQGETDLARLLADLRPGLDPAAYVFVSLPMAAAELLPALDPVATCREDEGLSAIVERAVAEGAGLTFAGTYRRIVLRVHSSLAAVGLTAAVAACLGARGIPANVVAAFHHDHVFVPTARADEALAALQSLTVPA